MAEAASPAQRIEAAGFAALLGLFRLLPVDAASALGGALGRLLGPLLRRRHRTALANLTGRLGAAPAAARAIRSAMWANLGRTVAELPHLGALVRRGRVELCGAEHLERALAGGRSVLAVTGHLGNWELLPFAVAAAGARHHVVYRAANNPASERLIQRLRAGGAASFVAKGHAGARRLARLVRQGEHIGFLVDQRLSDGVPVPFFGVPAMTAPAVAVLALRHRLPVLPMRCERLAGARFRIVVEPPLALPDSGDRTADVQALMAAVNARLETWIRARPEQWMWTHRRWPAEAGPAQPKL